MTKGRRMCAGRGWMVQVLGTSTADGCGHLVLASRSPEKSGICKQAGRTPICRNSGCWRVTAMPSLSSPTVVPLRTNSPVFARHRDALGSAHLVEPGFPDLLDPLPFRRPSSSPLLTSNGCHQAAATSFAAAIRSCWHHVSCSRR